MLSWNNISDNILVIFLGCFSEETSLFQWVIPTEKLTMVQHYRQIQCEKAYLRKKDCPPPSRAGSSAHFLHGLGLFLHVLKYESFRTCGYRTCGFSGSSFDGQGLELMGQTQMYAESSCFKNYWGAIRSKATGFGSNFFL